MVVIMNLYDWLEGPVVDVAISLLGMELVVGDMRVMIVETEAYAEDDPASHAITRKHSALEMMRTCGYVYVYKIYGVHHCLNFTADRQQAAAVLIRAAEPLSGLHEMKSRRGREDHLLDGPGKLCQGLGIDRSQNGQPLGSGIQLSKRTRKDLFSVKCSPRVGISQGVDKLWRFYLSDNPHISRVKENRLGQLLEQKRRP